MSERAGAPASRAAAALWAVRLLHTVVWAGFAGCIVAIPIAALTGALGLAAVLIAVVLVEVAVLLANRRRCPLTAVAARYTDDRAPNFDIFLPEWLARHNQTVFGWLYLCGIVVTLLAWWWPR